MTVYLGNVSKIIPYIDPFGAKESAMSKCNDVTRQVLYAKLHYNVLLWLNDKCTLTHTPVFKRSKEIMLSSNEEGFFSLYTC